MCVYFDHERPHRAWKRRAWKVRWDYRLSTCLDSGGGPAATNFLISAFSPKKSHSVSPRGMIKREPFPARLPGARGDGAARRAHDRDRRREVLQQSEGESIPCLAMIQPMVRPSAPSAGSEAVEASVCLWSGLTDSITTNHDIELVVTCAVDFPRNAVVFA
jgi:hypothetical protein